MTLLGAGLALLVGLVLGLLGGGGSVLTVPVLIYALHVPVKQAIATSLCVVGLVAFIGFLTHARQKTVAIKAALAFGPFAVVAAYAGAILARHIAATLQLIVFAVVGLAGSVMMFRGTSIKSSTPETTHFHFTADKRTLFFLALEGLAVGLLTGIIGVGGGFLIVPALVLVAKLPMRLAVGTSLLVITMNALSGFAGYAGTIPIDWALVTWFTAVAALGSITGTVFSKRVPQRQLRQAFGVLLMGVSLYVLYRR
ncbi:MAG TPA: sulfite exporter TauE/SafE family protein [Gemmatimonadaceae bacterium]|nr:sulfite exporter TauE/SafE family protein [Gemmatimonadaceae bacterium]